MTSPNTSARVEELLEANTRYLLRARKAEQLLSDLLDKAMGHIHTRHLVDVQEHIKTPWLMPEHK
jgi:hypothetical protein